MTRRLIVGLVVACALAAVAACAASTPSQPAAPSATTAASSSTTTVTVDAFVGQWGATTTSGSSPESVLAENTATALVPNGLCTLVEFQVDKDPDERSALIVFAATCANARIRGHGMGLVSGGTLHWKAEGMLLLASGRSCPFRFVEGNQATPTGTGLIKVTYNGTVCDIPVSGTQLVKRR